MAPTPRPSLKPSCSDWRPGTDRHRLTIGLRSGITELQLVLEFVVVGAVLADIVKAEPSAAEVRLVERRTARVSWR